MAGVTPNNRFDGTSRRRAAPQAGVGRTTTWAKNMRDMLEQIERGLETNLYYLSLFACLAISDICGAIDAEDGEASGPRYVAWYDKGSIGGYAEVARCG